MLERKYVIASSVFDSGTFMYISLAVPMEKRRKKYNGNIQDTYNLTHDDFNALNILITLTVNKYINQKMDTK